MNTYRMKGIVAAAMAAVLTIAAQAQQPTPFRDVSILKPPAGAKVAVIDFEDLECPACSMAAPIVRRAVEQYHVPLVHYDFPLKMHVWSFDAAVYARWIQDKVSPKTAEEYRLAVFAAQQSIASKDDLQRFTRKFAADHKLQLPFMVDPTGSLAAKVRADYAVGERLNIQHTPTIVVVTANHYQEILGDANQIYSMIEAAQAQTKAATPAVAHKTTHK